MKFQRLTIPEVVLITPKRFGDARGYFMETFRLDLFEEAVGRFAFVQDNLSLSVDAGTIRGLHFQMEPKAQGKLVSCVSGAIFDVAVDIRPGSPTYGRHVACDLTSESGEILWIPPGFAHGYCTLLPDTKVSYKVTNYYSAGDERGIAFDDPDIAVAWPVDNSNAVLSAKDRQQPELRDFKLR